MKVSKSYIRFLWGAVLVAGCVPGLFSCGKQQAVSEENHNQNMITQQSENLEIIQTKGGKLIYRFKAPLLEEYEYAAEPYIEFRKGIEIETYNDTTQQVEATLTANYAIYLKNQQLWEAKGNVRGHNADGNQIETEQLFWDQKSKRLYSNVDSKITQNDNVVYANRFESDEQFNDFVMSQVTGRVLVNTTPNRGTDSLSADSTLKPAATPVSPVRRQQPEAGEPDYPVIREGEAVARPKLKGDKDEEKSDESDED